MRACMVLFMLVGASGCANEMPPAKPLQEAPERVPASDNQAPPPTPSPAPEPAVPALEPAAPATAVAPTRASTPARVPLTEREKIEQVLSRLEKSDAVFIRAGVEYGGKEAAAHLRGKWSFAGSRIKTADEFITHLASKSSASGKPYQIKKSDGTIVTSEGWFRDLLKAVEGE